MKKLIFGGSRNRTLASIGNALYVLKTRTSPWGYLVENILNLHLKKISFPDFEVDDIDGIVVNVEGLGPINWVVRRVLRSLLRRHLRSFLEREAKEMLQQELQNVTVNDFVDVSLPMLLPISF